MTMTSYTSMVNEVCMWITVVLVVVLSIVKEMFAIELYSNYSITDAITDLNGDSSIDGKTKLDLLFDLKLHF